MEGTEMLTGKDIHSAFKKVDNYALSWDEIPAKAQTAYDKVADKLNASHIAPLQGLVQDLKMVIDGAGGWDTLTEEHEKDTLKRFNELIGEKP
jgi:hypothetical protein